MKKAFYDKCGENVELMSDIGARFQAVASELYSLACYEDFVLRQAFVQTATGKYLDYHAELRDKKRKSATKAKGTLVFSILEAVQSDIDIPKGTICAVKDKPYIQFETDEVATIKANEISTTVSATALEAGAQYNIDSGRVTVMVNPPKSVSNVVNSTAFIGGCDEESDEKLRSRLLKAYSVSQNGVSLLSIAQSIEKLPNVMECVVYQGDNAFDIYVKTANNQLDSELENQIKDNLMLAVIMNKGVNVFAANAKNVGVSILCKISDSSKQGIIEKIDDAVKACFNSVGIGEFVSFDKILLSIARIDGVENIEISSNDAQGNVFTAGSGEYLMLDNVEVNTYD